MCITSALLPPFLLVPPVYGADTLHRSQSEEDSVKEDMRLILEDKLLPENVQVLGFVLDIDTNKTREVFL